MDVSENRGTPKWMVKIMENPFKMDDLGVPLFLETPISLHISQKKIGSPSLHPHQTAPTSLIQHPAPLTVLPLQKFASPLDPAFWVHSEATENGRVFFVCSGLGESFIKSCFEGSDRHIQFKEFRWPSFFGWAKGILLEKELRMPTNLRILFVGNAGNAPWL